MNGDPAPEQTPRHAWLVALTAGLVIGFLTAYGTVLAISIAAALVAGAAFSRPRLASVGGSLMGVAYPWTLVWSRASVACDPGWCRAPDLTTSVGLSIALFVAGIAVSVVQAAIRRRSRL